MRHIVLTWAELEMAAFVGVRRHIEALKMGLKDKHGFDGDGWGAHVEGACGEMSTAKALQRYWDGSNGSFKRGDLGESVQIRTRSETWHELIVRDDDDPDAYFIHVVGKAPEYYVIGFIHGRAMRPEWRAAHGGREEAWFVPHGELTEL